MLGTVAKVINAGNIEAEFLQIFENIQQSMVNISTAWNVVKLDNMGAAAMGEKVIGTGGLELITPSIAGTGRHPLLSDILRRCC